VKKEIRCMVEIKKEGVLLEPTKFEFENHAVFNPGCIRKGNIVHLYYRAQSKDGISSI
jgi:predicted GH43/DUF377 family glycosyl hydrolase